MSDKQKQFVIEVYDNAGSFLGYSMGFLPITPGPTLMLDMMKERAEKYSYDDAVNAVKVLEHRRKEHNETYKIIEL